MKAEPVRVLIPRANMNDETVRLSRWLAEEGSAVEAGAPLAEVETSKAVLEIEAPSQGRLRRAASEGQDLPVGGVLCYLTEGAGDPIPEAAAREAPGARLSRKARALIEARGIDPARFAGMGLVRERDVLDLVEGRGEGLPAGARSKGAEWTRAELKESKRVEARSLLEGASNALASCVSAEMEAGRPPLARILKESAGLLLEHPFLNAFYDEGGVNLYSSVNVGFVIDAGRGIKVPVIRDAARRDAADIEREMQDLMLDYEEGTLGPSRLSGGTFTLTDLSELGADVFFPLIKEAQSAILGIGTRHLNLAFDHRVTEGREAALFLRDLKGRLKA